MYCARVGHALLDILFPPQCVGCLQKRAQGENFSVLCDMCYSTLELRSGFLCPVCARRRYTLDTQCHPRAPFVLCAATHYNNVVIQNCIHALKYISVKKAAHPLATLLTEYCTHPTHAPLFNFMHTAIFIPIPLHTRRMRERGFNQTFLIMSALCDMLKISHNTIAQNILIRIRHTPPQAELKGEDARRTNVAKCFAVHNPEDVRGKNIILCDDVTTSHATLIEAAQVLKIAGAKKIIGLVVAKA